MGSFVVLANSGGAFVGFLFLLALYFVPSIIGFTRSHHNKWAIFALTSCSGGRALAGSARSSGRSPDQRHSHRRSTYTTTGRKRRRLRRHRP